MNHPEVIEAHIDTEARAQRDVANRFSTYKQYLSYLGHPQSEIDEIMKEMGLKEVAQNQIESGKTIEDQKNAIEREKSLFEKVGRSQDLFAEGKISLEQMLKVEAQWKKSIDELKEINDKVEKGPEEVAQDQIETGISIEEGLSDEEILEALRENDPTEYTRLMSDMQIENQTQVEEPDPEARIEERREPQYVLENWGEEDWAYLESGKVIEDKTGDDRKENK